MRSLLSFILLFSINSGLFAQTYTEKFTHIVDSVYSQHPEMLGVLVYIQSPDKNIQWGYTKGFDGKNSSKNLELSQPMLIASTTKTYMAATVLKLVEKQKLTIDEPIKNLISESSRVQLTQAGYNLDSINVRHLLSHTSGIRDYVDDAYFEFVGKNKQHQWTRKEQIERAAKLGAPLDKPGNIFKYADVNYVLLSEVIEHFTNKPFYTSVRELMEFKKNRLNSTWFIQLEKEPKKHSAMVNQHVSRFSWNIKDLNPSWDLYGGGGIASNVEDMAHFYQSLFNYKIIKDKKVLQLMFTDVPPDLEINYCLGIRKIKVKNFSGYNHGGGLGTDVTYLPELNTSIAIAAVEADKRNIALQIRDLLIAQLANEKNKMK